MMEPINQKIIAAIKEHLPFNQKIVSYLVDLLQLSKESAYRRIRGEIPFTIEEMLSIVVDLGVSIDEILDYVPKQKSGFEIPSTILTDPIDGLARTLKINNNFIKNLSEAESSEVIIAFNRLSIIIHIKLDYVFKFLYYKYLIQTHDLPLNFSLSDLVLSEEIDFLRKEYLYYFHRIKNTTYIFDENIIPRFIKEVLYYYNRNLINKEELLLIQKDLFELIDQIYTSTQTGKNMNGENINIYLSMFDLSSTSSYIEYDSNHIVRLWINTITPVNLYGNEIVEIQKKWFTSLKKQSTLITQSSEMQQSQYINKQRKLVNEMMKNLR